jgi:hypothetical protein
MRASHAGSRPWFRSQSIQGWFLVGVAAVFTFVSLSTAGRLPGTDLPQHALFLQRILQGDTAVYDVQWWVPYTLSFWLAMPLAHWFGPTESIWIVTALAIALVPLAAAALATSLRRSPALGLFAYLAVFSTVLAWGFTSLVLSAAMFGFALSAALRYCRRPSALRGALLLLAIVASYFAHLFGFVVTVVAIWAVVLTWPRRVSTSLLWPAIAGTLIGFALSSVWLLTWRKPWAMGLSAALFNRDNHDVWSRLARFPLAVTDFGREGVLFPLPLAVLFVLALALSAYDHARIAGRARAFGLARRPALSQRLRALGRRFGFPIAFVVTGILYFTVPMWLGGIFFVYPRFLLVLAVLAPGALLATGNKGTHRLACCGIVPVLLLIGAASSEARINARRTQCVDRLAEHVRPGEAILGLWFGWSHAGYSAPVDLHLAAELAARRGASTGLDFTDYGRGPVAYQPTYDRLVVPATLLFDALLYQHDKQGREFTAWLLLGHSDFTGWIAQHMGKRPDLEVVSCGHWALVIDRSVEAGGRLQRAFMPHVHAHGSCALSRHPDVTEGLDRLLGRAGAAR